MTSPAGGGHDHGAGVAALVPYLALVVAGYGYAAVLAGQPPGPRAPTGRIAAWYAGLGVVAVALSPPIGGNHTVSAHMLQHELLLTVAPVLLVAGLDRRVTAVLHRTVVEPVLRAGAGRRMLGLLAGPGPATALWVAVVLGWHLPPVYGATLDDGGLHLARQASLVAAGVAFWVAVLRPPSVRVQQRIAALGVAMGASGVLGAVLVWSDAAIYAGRSGGASWFGLSPLQDQRLAGAVMMALDMPVLLGALGWVVAQWARQQLPAPDPDPGVPAVPARGGA